MLCLIEYLLSEGESVFVLCHNVFIMCLFVLCCHGHVVMVTM